MRDFIALCGICGFLFAVFIALAGCGMWFDNGMNRRACRNYAEITGRTTRYAEWDECYIETPQGWQRWDEYKARAVASEGLSD